MVRMTTERMREYQRERRERIRGGGVVQTVSGVLALVRGLEEEMVKVRERLDRLEGDRDTDG